MRYPDALRPVATETVPLAAGYRVTLPKATPRFRRWTGAPPGGTESHTPLVALNGEPLVAELAILRLFQAAGWEGAWIDPYHGKRKVGFTECVRLPVPKEALLQAIYQAANDRAGCFDVFCWQNGKVLFAEARHQGGDPIQPTQRRWLAAALQTGLRPDAFLLVEWALADA